MSDHSPAAGWAQRRRARGHSRLVHVLRWLLPTLILAMLGLLAAFVIADGLRSAATRPRETPTEFRMVSPHFIGRDDQGRAFNLAAEQAARDDANLQRVILTAPVLSLDVDGEHPKTLTADKGVYDEDTRILKLTGHVRADDSTASSVSTDEAIVDTKAGTVTGPASIIGAGPTGAIEANSYSADKHDGRIILKGGVHATLKGR